MFFILAIPSGLRKELCRQTHGVDGGNKPINTQALVLSYVNALMKEERRQDIHPSAHVGALERIPQVFVQGVALERTPLPLQVAARGP